MAFDWFVRLLHETPEVTFLFEHPDRPCDCFFLPR